MPIILPDDLFPHASIEDVADELVHEWDVVTHDLEEMTQAISHAFFYYSQDSSLQEQQKRREEGLDTVAHAKETDASITTTNRLCVSGEALPANSVEFGQYGTISA